MAEGVWAIADYGDLCGEGPLWHPTKQSLYWTDLARKRLYRFSWADRTSALISEQLQVSGFAFLASGKFLVTNVSGIWIFDPEAASGPTLIAQEADGRVCCMNDCVADPTGRVYSGSYRRDPASGEFATGAGSLFCVDHDGTVRVVDDGFRLSNGLAFSPDSSTLYFVDSAERRIYAYDWNRADGKVSRRRVLVQVPGDEGFPDGLTVDSEGFLWCAHWFGGSVIRYDPDGTLERRIEFPVSQVSSVTFGGPDLNDLFVTSAGLLDSTQLAPPSFDSKAKPVGGPVFQTTIDIQGRPEYFARVEPRA